MISQNSLFLRPTRVVIFYINWTLNSPSYLVELRYNLWIAITSKIDIIITTLPWKKATNQNGLTTLTSLGVSGFVHPVLHDWVRMIPIKLSYISSIFVRFVLEWNKWVTQKVKWMTASSLFVITVPNIFPLSLYKMHLGFYWCVHIYCD